MTVDRPFVGGGVKEAEGTCGRCTWGTGEHAEGCTFAEECPTAASLDNIDAILEEANAGWPLG